MIAPAVFCATALLSAPPATRLAVVIDDPAPARPVVAALEATLQDRGYQVVAPEAAARVRAAVVELDKGRLPETLSVFEADAVLAGSVTYGEPTAIEAGVSSVTAALTVRIIDLGTAETRRSAQVSGVGLGAVASTRRATAARRAIEALFTEKGFRTALSQVGQRAGAVTLIVQGLPNRAALIELRKALEKALAGAPTRELYFSDGLGKLILGGSRSPKAMTGPDIADVITTRDNLPVSVTQVANTRIVATYDPGRTIRVKALVLEPDVPRRRDAGKLGRFIATHLAESKFARASYQPGRLGRRAALRRARRTDANVIVESELLTSGDSQALAIRIIDVASGRPVFRQQVVLTDALSRLEAARALLEIVDDQLPGTLAAQWKSGANDARSTATAERRRQER